MTLIALIKYFVDVEFSVSINFIFAERIFFCCEHKINKTNPFMLAEMCQKAEHFIKTHSKTEILTAYHKRNRCECAVIGG